MRAKPKNHARNLERLRELSQSIHASMEDGSFYRLSFFERYRKIREIKKLYNRLLGSLSEASVRGAVSFASLLVLLAAPGCDDDTGMATVKIDLSTGRSNNLVPAKSSAYVPSEVTGVQVKVSGPGIKTFEKEIEPGENSIMLMVPAGRDRVFSVRAETATVYFYFGKETVDLNNGDMINLPISMVRGPVFSTTGTQVSGINLGTSDQVYPSFGDLDGDADMDLVVSNITTINYYQNSSGSFASATVPTGLVNNTMYRNLVDIDNDGDLDIYGSGYNTVSTFSPDIMTCNNSGSSANPSFDTATFFNLDITNYQILTFGDIDSDGDYDFITGRQGSNLGDSHTLEFHENTGTATNSAFGSASNIGSAISFANAVSPVLVDIDLDGDLDILVGIGVYMSGGETRLIENTGNATTPVFSGSPIEDPLSIDSRLTGTNVVFPAFADLDLDGDEDLYIGTSNGNILYFENLLFQ